MKTLLESWIRTIRTTRILHLAWVLLVLCCVQSISGETRIVCYYTNWSVYRPGTAKFSPQNINPYLCTHLIYAFGGFTNENALKPFDKYQDIENGGYAKFTGLKTYNKNLKTMLAIGGWNEGSSRFSPLAANPERRKTFVRNTIKFLRQNNFDGLDLDWEYPNFRDGGKPRDKDNYAQFVQELREEFENESKKARKPRLLLTMAAPAGIEYIDKGYDIPKLMKYLDWINLLTYDYHSAYEPSVNHHSPLYNLEEPNEYSYDENLNIDYTIKHYLEKGAERSKLVLGIPTYGRSYTLFNPNATELGSPADGPGEMGDATRENGYLAYYEICENLKSKDWTEVQPNPSAIGPYAYSDNQWVGYDDIAIVKQKAKYAAEQNMGGIMFWAIDTDDFRGNCHGKPFPLIEAAKEALISASRNVNQISPDTPDRSETKSTRRKPSVNRGGGPQYVDSNETRRRPTNNRFTITKNTDEARPSSSTTSRRRKNKLRANQRSTTTTTTQATTLTTPSYTTPSPPTTPDPGGDFKCQDEGFFPHPRDCKKYFWCLNGPSELGIVAHQFTCPAGLYFNKAADSCDYTQNVLCRKKSPATTTAATTSAASSTSTSTTTTTTSRPAFQFSSRRPAPPITAATSRTTFTTTTAAPEEDEYEEYEDEVDEAELGAEEDPQVIKELIMLIKKAGGIEELERQLQIDEGGAPSDKPRSETTTKFSRNLYSKVLSRANGNKEDILNKPASKSNSRGPQFNYQSINRGETEEKDKDRSRPSYTTINRQRPKTEEPPAEEEADYEEEAEDEVEEDKPSRNTPQSKYTTINRFSKSGEVSNARGPSTSASTSRPEYVTLRRRPTTSTSDTTTSKYKTINRGSSSSTTGAASEEEVTDAPAPEEVPEEPIAEVITKLEPEEPKTEAPVVKEEEPTTIAPETSSTVQLVTEASTRASIGSNRLKQFFNKRPAVELSSQTTQRTVEETKKVSQNDETPSRGVFKPRGDSSTTSERTPGKVRIRYRGSSRFSPSAEAPADGIPTAQGKFSGDDQVRNFRPNIAAEIADLSSLTAADITVTGNSKRKPSRRPLRPSADSVKTSSRTVNLAVRPSESPDFENQSKRTPLNAVPVVFKRKPIRKLTPNLRPLSKTDDFISTETGPSTASTTVYLNLSQHPDDAENETETTDAPETTTEAKLPSSTRVGRRKIIRKLRPTTADIIIGSTFPVTSSSTSRPTTTTTEKTTTVTEENLISIPRRKVIRRLRPIALQNNITEPQVSSEILDKTDSRISSCVANDTSDCSQNTTAASEEEDLTTTEAPKSQPKEAHEKVSEFQTRPKQTSVRPKFRPRLPAEGKRPAYTPAIKPNLRVNITGPGSNKPRILAFTPRFENRPRTNFSKVQNEDSNDNVTVLERVPPSVANRYTNTRKSNSPIDSRPKNINPYNILKRFESTTGSSTTKQRKYTTKQVDETTYDAETTVSKDEKDSTNEILETTEYPTQTSTETTSPMSTLVHIFAVNDDESATEDMDSVKNNEILSGVTPKIEKLIEINRWVHVSNDKEKEPKLDRIGTVNRLVSIQVSGGNASNEVGDTERATEGSKSSSPEYNFYTVDAGVTEPTGGSSSKKPDIPPLIIESKSVVRHNLYNQETSTIALEGLFHLNKSETTTVNPTTEASDSSTNPAPLVKVRILDQDYESSTEQPLQPAENPVYVPLRLLEDVTMVADVQEVPPKDATIRISPIAVSIIKPSADALKSKENEISNKDSIESSETRHAPLQPFNKAVVFGTANS